MNAMQKFEDAKSKAAQIMEQAKSVMKDAFMECVSELFNQNPSLQSFSWTQYTPYFNDGDECIFGANVYYPDINGEDGYNINNRPLRDKVVETLTKFDNEDYRNMFGNDATVIVKRDGTIDTEHCDHD